MGVDDGVCEAAPDGRHDFGLDEVLVRVDGADQVATCRTCGVPAYEASRPDERPPLGTFDT